MIVRQFRLLLLAREVLDRGGGAADVKQAVGVHAFVAGKIATQAKNFDRHSLLTIYRQLLSLDEAIKYGAVPAETALDMLVASFTPQSTLQPREQRH
jgi:DNA polymerase-3 subunit delta